MIIMRVVESTFDKAAMLWWSQGMRTLSEMEGDSLCHFIKNVQKVSQHSQLLFFCEPAMQHSGIFIINTDFILWYNSSLLQFLDLRLKVYLKMNFLNKETKSLKNTRKCVLFLSKTQPKHRKHSPITSPNVYAPTITADKHKLNLF